MTPTPPTAELLRYLAELGWGELRKGALQPRGTPSGGPRTVAAPSAPTGTEEAASPAAGARSARPLEEVATQAAACTRCRLAEGRRSVVFGSGAPQARLMVIGEAPGAEEDRQGLPFVGRAGEKLTQILAAIGLSRDEVYIANVVKCRPPGNRDPQADEVAACRGYLEAQIAAIRPQVLVALGRVAAQALLGTDQTIGRLRGHWYTVLDTPTMVTYHPAAILRDPKYRRPTWEDMQQVRDRLAASS